MKKLNIGNANLCVSDKIKKTYFNDDLNLINESKTTTSKFLEVLKNSPLLMLEFKVYNNLENKTIDSEVIATRYIDNNIKLFETFTVSEINEEHEKLKNFINEDVEIDKNKEKLYESINNLIIESISSYDEINVDDIHESFTCILNYLKKNKETTIISENKELLNNEIIEIAIDKFNDRYSELNEDDKNLIKTLVKSKYNEKVKIFENYKISTIESVKNLNAETYGEKIDLTINKINEMKIDENVIEDNIIILHELKKSFI